MKIDTLLNDARLPRVKANGRDRGLQGFTARFAWLAAAALLAMPATGTAGPLRYSVDAGRSQVDFRIHYLGIFSLGGQFNGVVGTVVFDPDRWETLQVAIRIPVNSLETRPGFWRGELLGPNFFESGRYPTIEFSTTRTLRTGPSSAEAWGNLTLRSVTRPILLKARIVREADSTSFAVEADVRLQRSAFGLGGALPLASDDVTIVLHLRMMLADVAN